MKVVKESVEIQNRRGLHARASAKVVRLVEAHEADVFFHYQDMCVSGASIMGLLMLGAAQGAVVIIEAQGRDAPEAVASLVELIEQKFGE